MVFGIILCFAAEPQHAAEQGVPWRLKAGLYEQGPKKEDRV